MTAKQQLNAIYSGSAIVFAIFVGCVGGSFWAFAASLGLSIVILNAANLIR